VTRADEPELGPAESSDEELVEVVEGLARLLIPAAERTEHGPGDTDAASVFFNPTMALARDVSSLAFACLARAGMHVLDGMGASGARGIRYALEADVDVQVEWNDWHPKAVARIQDNATRNGLLADGRVTRLDLTVLLRQRVWDFVDIDPYGSPAPFLDAAARAVRHDGLLGVTATDTGALAGTYPAACRRRYLAEPMHGHLGHEVALRILAGAVTRHAAKHEVAATPLLAHASDHFDRVLLRVQRGARRADAALANIGHLLYCRACGHTALRAGRAATACPGCAAPEGDVGLRVAGPLWVGPLQSTPLLDAMAARLATHPLARPKRVTRLVTLLADEAHGPLPMHDLDEVGARLHCGSVSRDEVMARLRAAGHHAARVHFCDAGLRTDAPVAVLDDIVHAIVAERA